MLYFDRVGICGDTHSVRYLFYFSWEKVLYMCCYVCLFEMTPTVLQCVLCLPLSMTQLSRLLPPGSGSEVRRPPTQQRAGTEGGGRQVAPLMLVTEHECGLEMKGRGRGGLTPHPFPSTSNHPEATSHSPPRSLLCWSWWILWRSVSGGLDFLTKPFGPRAATAALGQCARPKLTQPTLLQNLTKKKKPNGVSLSICHLWEWSKFITPYQILLFDHILNPLSFSTLKQMEYDNVNEVFDPTEHSSLFSCGQDRWRLLYIL